MCSLAEGMVKRSFECLMRFGTGATMLDEFAGGRFLLAACVSAALTAGLGCAGGGSGGGTGGAGSGSGSAADTHATLLITSTNNAQIPIFKFNAEAVSLVASDGTVVPVLTSPQVVELGSINGVARPMVSVDIPQGDYKSVQLDYGPSSFVVIDESGGPGTIDVGNYNVNAPGTTGAEVDLTLPTPLVVRGDAMGLMLNLNIPQSTTYTPFFAGSTNIQPGGGESMFNPVFTFTGVTIAAEPTSLLNGKVEDVHGQVTASSGGTLTMTSDNGTSFNFGTSSSTVYAGAGGAQAPPVGSFVDVDANLESDGTMLATLVQSESLTQQYDLVGQGIEYSLQTYLNTSGREQQGPNLPNGTGFIGDNVQFGKGTQFEVAWPGGVAPTGLPFTPTFGPSSIVPGQNVATPTDSQQYVSGVIPTTNFVTLEPQTVDGVIASVNNVNGQASYVVTLYPNDLMAIFGPSTTVNVYATAATQPTTSSTLAAGSVARFRGLVFNDASAQSSSTLQMVASEIEDGVGP
jgi:hypothetical protein